MSNDPGSPITPRRTPSLELPAILKLRIRLVPYEAPKLDNFRSSLEQYQEAIEFIVETGSEEVQARAYGPALFVGDIEVNHGEYLGKSTWRFLAFEPAKLKDGAPISWGWMKDPPAARQRTRFKFMIEGRK